MNWKILALLTVALLVFAACGAPAPTMDGEQSTAETENVADAAEAADQTEGADSDTAKSDTEAPAEAVEAESAVLPVVSVYKSPTCGCCTGWVEHMEEAGFEVEAHDVNDLATVKNENQVPGGLQSCHTAIVDGYVIEGHVPAEDISELLTQRPDVAGLAVPGMPVGSPGMEMPGNAGQPFDVVTFDVDGHVEVFASHNQ